MTSLNPLRALVLSGGGGRGAYHVGVLRFLEEHEWYPDIIVGTSIGAVNGAALASGHSAHSLWALWRRLKTDDVQRRAWDLFSLDKWNHLLDTAPLRKTLVDEGWIDLDRINAQFPSKHLRVTVVEMETGRLRVFGNSADPTSGSRCEHVPITLDHILASCSIPIVYPPTRIGDVAYWDGGTVANTPLGPAIDAGAEDIVVVLMTPWEDEESRPRYSPAGGIQGLLSAAQAAFEWALLASFQADLKLFRRTNEVVRLRSEIAQLRIENATLKANLAGQSLPSASPQAEVKHRQVQSPVIVSPQDPIPVGDIIRYDLDNHEKLHEMGYENAKAAWRRAGRKVEGEGS
jgi:NTE family protein